MNRPFTLLGPAVAAAAVVVVAITACGSTSTSSYGPAPSAAPSISPVVASPSANSGTEIQAGSSRLGQILVDSSGRTLYLFVADKGTASVCNSAACVQYWPPLLTTGAPVAGAGVNAALLGTTTRTDGKTQVTYAGHPLYYFITDKKPGDVTGQGIDGFGGPWYVVSPAGMQIG